MAARTALKVRLSDNPDKPNFVDVDPDFDLEPVF